MLRPLHSLCAVSEIVYFFLLEPMQSLQVFAEILLVDGIKKIQVIAKDWVAVIFISVTP